MAEPGGEKLTLRPRDGAEAVVLQVDFLGIPALKKVRIPKEYRQAELDLALRTERLRTEVRLLREARRMGVRTPHVLDINEQEHTLVMERVEGRTLTDIIADPLSPKELKLRVVDGLGIALGKLHAGKISHGDLTGSNVIWTGKEVVLIDMSMGSRTPELEDMGIDLHLVEEDLNTLTPLSEELHQRFLEGYRRNFPGAESHMKRAREIKGRVRYS